MFDSNTMELYTRTLLCALSLFLCFPCFASAIETFRKATVTFEQVNNSFLLATKSSPVTVHVDAADWPGVLRAAHDLAIDFGRVTGLNGTLKAVGTGTANASSVFNVTGIPEDWSVGNSTTGQVANTRHGTIIVGTVGNSSFIDGLIKSGKLNISGIEGQWEAYVSTRIKNPINGTEEALVIAG